jgi:hypothetical protein
MCLMMLNLAVSASETDPNVISAVVRSNSTLTAPVLVKGGLVQGAQIFADRTTFFYSDAGIFKGLDYVQTTMDDKTDADVQYQVSFSKPGTLFLIVDNRVGNGTATTPPTLGSGVMNWAVDLGFTATPYTIGFSEPATVYALSVGTDPNTILLGAQNDGSSRAMYAIAAAPAGWNLPPQILGVPATALVALPATSLAINGSVADDGLPGTGVSVLWTVVNQPAGSTVQFTPNAAVANPTVAVSAEGVYTLKMTANDGDKVSEKTLVVTLSPPIFALQATGNTEIGNDSSLSPNSRSNGSGIGARNVDNRRRVAVISYNISAARDAEHPEEVFANACFNVHSQTRGGVITVYGVKEHLDTINYSTISWNTCPGLPRPAPALNTPVSVFAPELVGPLMTIALPATGTRATTNPSPELTEFLNSDIDGNVTFLFTGLENLVDNNIVYSTRYTSALGYPNPSGTGSLWGVILLGQRRVPTWAHNPQPLHFGTASPTLTQLCWTNPQPSAPEGQITCDVYFSANEPNELLPNDGFQAIATGVSGSCVPVPYALQAYKKYYWKVNVHDSSLTPGLTEGMVWSFTTDNAPPVVNAGADQYLWLNNAGAPASATVSLSGSVTDDGLPSGILTRLWTQASGPAQIIDPNGVILATQVLANTNNVTLVLPQTGTYQFVLTGNDGTITSSDTVQVVTAATPCLAAKAVPGYTAITGDLDGDCYVDIRDLAVFVSHWLECSSLAPCY